eukprot:PhM_4_TR5649/c0_g1_i2/m.23/K08292/EEF2K; elongation factor 2 kinase
MMVQRNTSTGAPITPDTAQYYQAERAVRYEFNASTGDWESKQTMVKLSAVPFAQGGMRYCVYVREVEPDGGEVACIGKFFLPQCKAKNDDYFMEASAQCTAETFAQEYNRQDTPKKVAFLTCYVVHLLQRQTQNIFIMEPVLRGRFTKHNNNYGEVYTDSLTPEAFSHFTYHVTRGRMLVCDIQGVGEFFTDPQIHTPVGTDYGMGNMGADGIQRWLKAHKCNEICRRLRLPAMGGADAPQQTYSAAPSNGAVSGQTSHQRAELVHRLAMESYCRMRPGVQSDDDPQVREAMRRSLTDTLSEEERIQIALQRSMRDR